MNHKEGPREPLVPREKTIEFRDRFGSGGNMVFFFSPGRINIIGEHLDYNGGHVLPAAISLGIYAVVRYRDDGIVRLASSSFDGLAAVSVNETINPDNITHWVNYPLGVIKHLREGGYAVHGCDILFFSTLPDGAGLSSSASLETLTAFITAGNAFNSDTGRVRMAEICRHAENEFVGVNCGIMDQFAVSMGRKNHAMLLKTDTLEHEFIPADLRDHRFVIMYTGKKRALSGSAFNTRRDECMKALDAIRKKRPVASLCDAALDDLDFLNDPVLVKRTRHVITENRRVLDAAQCMRDGDAGALGKKLNETHESLRDAFEVTGMELDGLVSSARDSEGCAGARMTGAGFGGCAIALVMENALDEFITAAGRDYERASGLRADFYVTGIEDGVRKTRTSEGNIII